MKKIIGLFIFFIFLYSCASAGIERKKKMDKYDYWFNEEVALLITPEDKTEFLSLTTDEEKYKFIEVFWARRDPSPGTEENEFKDEWYQRLEYVNKTFTRGVKRGWRSDMGRVYMFFGPPWRITATPPTKRKEPMGGHQQDLGEHIWVYRPKLHLGLLYDFNVIFIEYQYGYDLADVTPQIIRRALEIYPNSVILNPDEKDSSQ
jgi:GWxTD domain-containing protein